MPNCIIELVFSSLLLQMSQQYRAAYEFTISACRFSLRLCYLVYDYQNLINNSAWKKHNISCIIRIILLFKSFPPQGHRSKGTRAWPCNHTSLKPTTLLSVLTLKLKTFILTFLTTKDIQIHSHIYKFWDLLCK